MSPLRQCNIKYSYMGFKYRGQRYLNLWQYDLLHSVRKYLMLTWHGDITYNILYIDLYSNHIGWLISNIFRLCFTVPPIRFITSCVGSNLIYGWQLNDQARDKNRFDDLVEERSSTSIDDLFVKDKCLWKLYQSCRWTFIARQKFSHFVGERREADVCYRSIGSPDSREIDNVAPPPLPPRS